MMEPMNDEAALANGYGFGYTQEQEASYAALNYGQHVPNYALQHPGATRGQYLSIFPLRPSKSGESPLTIR